MAREGHISRLLTWAITVPLIVRVLTRHQTGAMLETTDEPKPTHNSPNTAAQSAPEPNNVSRKSGLAGKYQLVSKSISQFMDDDGTTMAAALAYYTTFSIAPLLLIVISIVGLVFGRQAVQHQIDTQIQGLIGQGAATQVGAMVKNAAQHSSTGVVAAILGVLALIAGATGSFTQLQSSLNRIWRVKPDPRVGGAKNFIGHRILSLGMIAAVAFLLIVSLAVSAALSAFGGFLSSLLPQGFSHVLLMAINFIVSLAIIAGLFAAMFKVLPDAKIQWRDVWIGAGMTAVLFTIGKFLIGMYLGHSGTASAYGTAGSFVLVVLWIYYSSLIFLFGAELTAAWAEAHSGPVEPKPGAVKVETQEKIQPGAADEPRRAA